MAALTVLLLLVLCAALAVGYHARWEARPTTTLTVENGTGWAYPRGTVIYCADTGELARVVAVQGHSLTVRRVGQYPLSGDTGDTTT